MTWSVSLPTGHLSEQGGSVFTASGASVAILNAAPETVIQTLNYVATDRLVLLGVAITGQTVAAPHDDDYLNITARIRSGGQTIWPYPDTLASLYGPAFTDARMEINGLIGRNQRPAIWMPMHVPLFGEGSGAQGVQVLVTNISNFTLLFTSVLLIARQRLLEPGD